MNIAVVGTGYVGLVSGTCFAEMGVNVYCVDIDQEKINKLNNGIIPIYEEGLAPMVEKNIASGRLHFVSDLKECLDEVDIVFIAVGTPPDAEGNADLKYVFSVAETFADNIKKYTLLVTKSTVPVGTSSKIYDIVKERIAKRGEDIPFDVASNPEFLKEGAAIKDFMMPDRVVIGIESERAKKIMSSLYRPFLINRYRVIFMDNHSSEMTKYVSNAMLATRISFMNEVARLCEITGADVNCVRTGVAADSRIGSKFLYPGCGYGGSCFPKDVKALIGTAAEHGYNMQIINAVENVNEEQKKIVFYKLKAALGSDLKDKTIALWGLAFKPGTDDIREAPSIEIINLLLEAGAKIRTFDPVAMDGIKAIYGDKIEYCNDIYSAANGADAVALITEWKEFRIPNWETLRDVMNGNVIVDGRNIYDMEEVCKEGFEYFGIGVM